VCLPLLISPCTIKSRSSLLAPAHLGGPGKRAVKRLLLCCCIKMEVGMLQMQLLRLLTAILTVIGRPGSTSDHVLPKNYNSSQ